MQPWRKQGVQLSLNLDRYGYITTVFLFFEAGFPGLRSYS